MTSPTNQRSEQIIRSMRAERQFEDMLNQAHQARPQDPMMASGQISPLDARAEKMAGILDQQAVSHAEMGLRAIQAGNQARRRQISRKAVRDLAGLLLILAVLGWLFMQWMAPGGWLR